MTEPNAASPRAVWTRGACHGLLLGLALVAGATACSRARSADDSTAARTGVEADEPLPPAARLEGDGSDREQSAFHTTDGTAFSWRRWGSDNPELVLLCVHGLGGAVEDYDFLASRLDLDRFALYTYDLRAMGRDPVVARRGAITDHNDWSRDLLAFDAAVRQRHPGVPVAWYGESLGALIILQTHARHEQPKLAGVGLASPIVAVRGKLSRLSLLGVSLGCNLMPERRIKLGAIAGNGDPSGSGESYGMQLAQTPWAVDGYTLRTLCQLRAMAERAPSRARALATPLLVLHGGRDMFENPTNISDFLAASPQVDITYHYYAGGHHLLLYDQGYRDRVAEDIAVWLDGLPK